ncbi:MAG: acyl-[acyl-carrier-protein] thioesterase [Lachnospiraceae bacterium]|nr:acyl-[acyl-carrier-protein] thioesterase [Lachnospiraceae bacterium]
MFSFRSRIRYSECDSNGHLALTALLNYFQDCSTLQSEELGIGVKALHEKGTMWVVNSWQIDIGRFPELGEEVETITLPYDIKGFFGRRNFCMKDASGEYLAKADSLWTYISMASGKPERIPDDILRGYKMDTRLEMDYLGRKISNPADIEGREMTGIPVTEYLLDANHHVNNGKYVELASGMVPGVNDAKRLRVEYRKQAFLGETIIPTLYETKDRVVIRMSDTTGNPYAIVEFSDFRSDV